jgi:cytochrome b6-f complex subunit 7
MARTYILRKFSNLFADFLPQFCPSLAAVDRLRRLKYHLSIRSIIVGSGAITMTAESMLFNGPIVASVLVLVGLAWGFLLLKIQGGEAE